MRTAARVLVVVGVIAIIGTALLGYATIWTTEPSLNHQLGGATLWTGMIAIVSMSVGLILLTEP